VERCCCSHQQVCCSPAHVMLCCVCICGVMLVLWCCWWWLAWLSGLLHLMSNHLDKDCFRQSWSAAAAPINRYVGHWHM
jgi:hypothetical protein